MLVRVKDGAVAVESQAGDGLELQDLQAAPEPAAETVAEPGRVEAPAEAEDDFADFDVDEEIADIDDLEDEELEAAETGKAGIKLPQLDVGNSKTRFIAIGVVVGLVLVVGVGFWMKLRAVETIEPAAPTAQAGEPATSPGPAAAAEAQPAETPPAEVETTPPVPGEDVATLLDRANTAYEAGDYASAIVALDAVLKQDPGHFEANEKMQAATAAYKRQQEVQQQWGAAAALFRDGEFRSAMQMFYRLPVDGEENRLRLERYKVNGWYNMGLLALRSGQCELARSHFSEASQIDPEDADVEMALALCDTCEGGTRRSGFQRALASMKMRSLDS